MREIDCDVAVIGAGTAGIAAHRAALEAGAKSVLIERGPGGTTCARVGCMPSKVLITAATAAFDARDAGRFGIGVDGIRIDGPAVMKRVRRLRDDFVASVFEGLDDLTEDSRITGNAVFEGPDLIRVDDGTRVRFRAAVIATGSSPNVPEALSAVAGHVLTTDSIFEIDDLPSSIAVLGAGPVGIELAQAMARLDVETHLFDTSSTLGGLSDPDLQETARALFGKEIALKLDVEVARTEPVGANAALHWTGESDGSGTIEVARILSAAGRPPNVDRIGLDRTGVTLDEKGGPTFDPRSLACEGAPILIAGDANRERPILHEARRQGRIAGRNAAALARGAALERPEPMVALAVVYTHPQIALVGQGYDAQATDRLVGRMSFRDQGRARIMGRNEGGMRVYADRAGKLLGAEMLGPDVEHLAHLLAFAIADGHSAASLVQRPFYHPTLEEGLKTALSEIAEQVEG